MREEVEMTVAMGATVGGSVNMGGWWGLHGIWKEI